MSRTSTLLLSLASAVAITASAAPGASADAASGCVLPRYTIGAVAPHLEVVRSGGAAARRVDGAEILVVAEPGLTAAWLRLQIDRHRGAHHAPSADCVLDVPGTDVSVAPRGADLLVTVRAADDDTAREVLRRAHALRPPS